MALAETRFSRTTTSHGAHDASNGARHIECHIGESDDGAALAMATTFGSISDSAGDAASTAIATVAVANPVGGDRFSMMESALGCAMDDCVSYYGSVTASPSDDEMYERVCLRCEDIEYILDDPRDTEIVPPRQPLSRVGRPANTTGRIRVGWKYQVDMIPRCVT